MSAYSLLEHDEQVQSVFSKHGLRFTRQRCAVYRKLAETSSHPTADEIYQQVSQGAGDISLATVYNSLEAMCNAGLVQKLPDNGGSARYDASTHNHLHLRDQRTGRVHDVPERLSQKLLDQLSASLLDQIESELGFRVDQVRIELVGEQRTLPS